MFLSGEGPEAQGGRLHPKVTDLQHLPTFLDRQTERHTEETEESTLEPGQVEMFEKGA